MLPTHLYRLLAIAVTTIGIGASISRAGEAEKPPATSDDPGLILDQTGYFRQFTEFGLMRISGAHLKKEGEKLFGKGLSRLGKTVKHLLKRKNFDWTKTDWKDEACYHIASIQAGDDTVALSMIPNLMPPPDWMKPGFDDTSFLRQRIGVLTPVTPQWGAARERSSVHRRAVYARTYFEVPNPAQAGKLTLKIVYRGGARVFVNGSEVGRGHLPEGEVGQSSYGADYPLDAYLANADELPKKAAYGPWIGDLRCPFEHAPGYRHDKTARSAYGGAGIFKKGWGRLRKLRDRVLGPIDIPAKLLKKGTNVIAIEVRTSMYHPRIIPGAGGRRERNWSNGGANGNVIWDHLRLVGLELRTDGKGLPSGRKRPAGMQVWVDDMHNRLFNRDYNPTGWPVGTARFVAAQNGTFAAQLGVGTDAELSGLKVVCSDLAANGKKIPASALKVQFMVGRGLGEMSQLGWFRSISNLKGLHCPMSNIALYRYSRTGSRFDGALDGITREKYKGAAFRGAQGKAITAYMEAFKFFDQIGDAPPEKIPANSCQPIWLSLQVPGTAAPGEYKGKVTVSAEGGTSIAVPVEAEVQGWRVPDPLDFQTVVQSEQSPYGVARGYKVELWSDKHFELMESSFKQLARIGNDWLFIPVLLSSEFGNRDDQMITWIRKKDGSMAFDFALLDRYIALARKHLGKPRVVCFVIMHGATAKFTAVKVKDEATGKTEVVKMGDDAGVARIPKWRAFGRAVHARMKELGLGESHFWGHAFDDTVDPGLVALMTEVTPGVGWAAGSHARKPDGTFRAVALAYGMSLTPKSMMGWKNPDIVLLMPRTGGSMICVEGISTPFTWRVMCDRAIYCGLNGLGRMGADYFGKIWLEGFRGGAWMMVGRPCVQTLWPGANGVDTSARNETMLEGIQEAEARIFVEQALDRGGLPEEMAKRVQAVLDKHYRDTLQIAAGGTDYITMDFHGDWQGRSRRLFGAAAEVAAKIGLDVDRAFLGQTKVSSFAGKRGDGKVIHKLSGRKLSIPALGKRRVSVKLRNWSDKPRTFKVRADQSWIVPEKSEGSVTGQQELGINLDGKTLNAGSDITGKLTVTDAVSGAAYPIEITAQVVKALELRLTYEVKYETGGGAGGEGRHTVHVKVQPIFNVMAGETEQKEFMLVNNTASAQKWKIETSDDWLTASPSSGEIGPEATSPVKLTARPKAGAAEMHETTVTFTAANGAVKESKVVKIYAFPEYTEVAAPAGTAIYLNDPEAKKLYASHIEYGYKAGNRKAPWWARGICFHRTRPMGENLNQTSKYREKRNEWQFAPYKMGGKTYKRGLWVFPYHETVYKVEGAGVKAFAADVGFFEKFLKNSRANKGALVSFEIHVDGKLRAASGLMKITDKPKPLVVDGLQKAKQLKLVTRRDDLTNDNHCLVTWGDPRFIK